jgi:hypothetical protein
MANMHLVTGYAGTEHITAADQGSFNASLFGSGQYVLDRGNKFAASIVTNNQITVLDGDILMQGRHIRVNEGSYVDLTIENGAQGMLRNDLVVVRYTKNSESGKEEANLVVIKGTAVASNPSDPAYTSGDIINSHVLLNDMPLYRVVLNGLTIQKLVPLFDEASLIADGSVTEKKLDPTYSGKLAKKSSVENGTLLAASWEGTEVPYTYSLSVSGVTSTSIQEVLLSANITQEQLEAAQSANIQDAGQSKNTILLKAWGEKPAIDIPIRIIKRGDA